MENWNYASAASKGVIARRYPYKLPDGDGLTRARRAPARLGHPEHHRAESARLYKRWAEFMDADNWEDLMTPKDNSQGKPLN